MTRTAQLAMSTLALLTCACAGAPSAHDDAWDTVRSPAPFASSTSHPVLEQAQLDVWGEHHAHAHGRSGLMELAFVFYRDHLTKVDGPRCEHRPTCARYTIEAMRHHGFVVGAMLGIDRLLRTNRSSSLRMLPILKIVDGKPYYSDPVEENDFFF